MKRTLHILFFSSIISIAWIIADQHQANTYSSGAPSGRTGSPGNSTCATSSCHSGTLNSGSGTPSITSNIPGTGWIGGRTYTITASIAQSNISKFGFQVNAEDQSGNDVGDMTITNSTTTKIVGTYYVTHTSSGTSGTNSRSWSFDWTAPCAGEDTVVFYGAFNAANGNSSRTGDLIYTTTLKVAENLQNWADSVDNITMSDVGNMYDGRDLRIRFDAPECETKTDEYRVMVVPTSQASSFDTAAANAVGSANYLVVNTGSGGNTVTRTLTSTSSDVNGDAIRNNRSYKVFVLGMPDVGLVTQNSLVESASSITLTSPMVGVSGITAEDIGESGNGEDLEVTFTAPSNEAPVDEYRVIAVKTSSAPSFNLSAAQALTGNTYEAVATGTPGSISVAFNSSSEDSDGDAIANYVSYRIYILTVADGIISITDSLQIGPDIMLEKGADLAVGPISGLDVGNNGDGTDLEATFQSALDESTLREYRVIAVKVAAASSFDIDDANALTSDQYAPIHQGDDSNGVYTVAFSSNSEDSDGDLIKDDEPYILFVMSVADGTVATMNTMVSSDPDEVVLKNTVGIENTDLVNIRVFTNDNQLIIAGQEMNARFRILSTSGQMVKTGAINSDRTVIDVSSLESALYIVQIIDGQSFYTQKIIIE